MACVSWPQLARPFALVVAVHTSLLLTEKRIASPGTGAPVAVAVRVAEKAALPSVGIPIARATSVVATFCGWIVVVLDVLVVLEVVVVGGSVVVLVVGASVVVVGGSVVVVAVGSVSSRNRTNTSYTWFVSPGTRLSAGESNPMTVPSALIVPSSLAPPSGCSPE